MFQPLQDSLRLFGASSSTCDNLLQQRPSFIYLFRGEMGFRKQISRFRGKERVLGFENGYSLKVCSGCPEASFVNAREEAQCGSLSMPELLESRKI